MARQFRLINVRPAANGKTYTAEVVDRDWTMINTEVIKLSPTVKAICTQNYDTNCGKCPLRPVCCESFPTTYQALNDHTERLNKLAEEVPQ